jgi:hypothetical protein
MAILPLQEIASDATPVECCSGKEAVVKLCIES